MGSQASGYKRKAPVALTGAFQSGPLAAGEDGQQPAGTKYTMLDDLVCQLILPNKSLTQNDLAAWGRPIGRVKGYTGYTENQCFAYSFK